MKSFALSLFFAVSFISPCWAVSKLRGTATCPCFSLEMMIDHFKSNNNKLGSCTITQAHDYHRRVVAHTSLSEKNFQVFFFDVTPTHCGFQYSKDLNKSPTMNDTEGHVSLSLAEFAACEAVFEAFVASSVCPDPPSSLEVQ